MEMTINGYVVQHPKLGILNKTFMPYMDESIAKFCNTENWTKHTKDGYRCVIAQMTITTPKQQGE